MIEAKACGIFGVYCSGYDMNDEMFWIQDTPFCDGPGWRRHSWLAEMVEERIEGWHNAVGISPESNGAVWNWYRVVLQRRWFS